MDNRTVIRWILLALVHISNGASPGKKHYLSPTCRPIVTDPNVETVKMHEAFVTNYYTRLALKQVTTRPISPAPCAPRPCSPTPDKRKKKNKVETTKKIVPTLHSLADIVTLYNSLQKESQQKLTKPQAVKPKQTCWSKKYRPALFVLNTDTPVTTQAL